MRLKCKVGSQCQLALSVAPAFCPLPLSSLTAQLGQTG